MDIPSSLRPVAFDAAAAAALRSAIAGVDGVLGFVLSSRAARVADARQDWSGQLRDEYDAADDDLRDAARLVGRQLDDLRARLGRAEALVQQENRDRAWARARWRQRQSTEGGP